MRQAAYSIRLPGWMWSLVLAVEALNRATSYLLRPPNDNGLTPVVNETQHMTWSLLLLVGAALLFLGIGAWLSGANWAPWLVMLGHVVLVSCVMTFAMSIGLSALTEGGAWSGFGPLVVLAILHAERALCAGTNIGRT